MPPAKPKLDPFARRLVSMGPKGLHGAPGCHGEGATVASRGTMPTRRATEWLGMPHDQPPSPPRAAASRD